jgi:hypothetical protein
MAEISNEPNMLVDLVNGEVFVLSSSRVHKLKY